MVRKFKTNKFDLNAFQQAQSLLGLSDEELGRTIGMTGRTVANFKKGATSPTVKALIAFCNAYGLDVRQFFIQDANGHKAA